MNSIASTPMFLFNIVIVLGSYAGYRAYELLCEPPEPSRSIPEPDHDASPPAQETSPARRDTSGTVSVNNQRNLGVGLAAMSISATRWIGLSIPFAAPASLALTVVATLPILRRAERSLTSRRVDNDLLTSMVSVTTIGLGQFVAAGLQATSYHFGQFMAEWSKASAQKSVLDVIDPPGAVWRRVGESVVSTPLEDLNAGDIVVVEAGEVIPVDGTVVRGNASVDERVLTGESVPADKEVGDRLLASTLVVSGTVELEVSRTGSETAAARIAALLERTQHYKSEQQLRAERWSDGAALPVLLTSAVITPFRGLSSAASIMFAVPSNAIRSTGSMQTAGHLTAATRRGILVCDGRGLEALARVDTVLFDKTGTLTEDGLHFESVVSTGRQDPDLVLAWAAALDQRISHPIARSLVDHAEQQGLELPAVEDLSVAMGGGVQGRIDGHDVLFGSRRFIERHDIDVEAQYDPREPPDAPCTEVFLASDGQLHGVISLRPRVRPEARRVVGQLRAAGIQTLAVVSGDTPAPTEFVAGQLGLDRWYAETLPEQKA